MSSSFERKLKQEMRSQKVEYWDKISRGLPMNRKEKTFKEENYFFKQVVLKRITPLVLTGALATFAFFSFSNIINTKAPDVKPNSEEVKLSDLIISRNKILDENQTSELDTERSPEEIEKIISYLSED